MSERYEVKDGSGQTLYVKDPFMEWIDAFTNAQEAMPLIGKGSTVDAGPYTYSYASLPDILEKVRPVLLSYGLSIAQSVTFDTGVQVETRIYHVGGHVEVFGPLGIPGGGNAQAIGSAITYARRYALCAALGIAPDEDDDGVQASKPPEDASQWLAKEVEQFKLWTPEEVKQAWAMAAEAIRPGKPINRAEAEAVLAHMKNAYQIDQQTSSENHGDTLL